MSKSLGQVAYEAWHLEHMSPGLTAPYPKWEILHDDDQAAWQAAAEAVVSEALDEMADSIERERRLSAAYDLDLAEAKNAVIEAAKRRRNLDKEVEQYIGTHAPGDLLVDRMEACKELDRAVEALQELEGE